MIDITTYDFSIRLESVNFLIDIPDQFLSLPKDTLSKEEQEFIKQEVSTYHLKNQISLSHFNPPYDTKNPDDIPDYEITDFSFDNDLPDLEYSIEKDMEEQAYSLTAENPLEMTFECKTLANTDADLLEFDITDALDEALNYTDPCFEYNYDTVLSIEDTNTQSVYPDDLYDSNPTLYQLWDKVNQKALQDEYNIHTYDDFAKQCGDMILCNEMQNRLFSTLEPYSGQFFASKEDKEQDNMYEIFQWYIIGDEDFAIHHTNEMIFYDDELDLYILGVTHYGTTWKLVSPPELHEGTASQSDYYDD